jgi:hypothetical protein
MTDLKAADDAQALAVQFEDRGRGQCQLMKRLRRGQRHSQEIKKRMRPLFTQKRVATNAGLLREGLLGDERH